MPGAVITLGGAYRDRLAGLGPGIIEFIFNRNSGKIVVRNEVSLSPKKEEPQKEELTRGLLTILHVFFLHVFFCRLHGLGKYKAVKRCKTAFKQTR